jgi:hypothetical protein
VTRPRANAQATTCPRGFVGGPLGCDHRVQAADGYELVGEFYDAAVSGADPIDARPGFAAMLERIEATACGRSWSRPPAGSRAT